MVDGDTVEADLILSRYFADRILRADEQDVYAVFPFGFYGAFDDFERGVIAAESIYDDFHITKSLSI